jgi:carboxylate-amine ligase
MRMLARREPTMAQHVHVAVPDADAAVRALDGLRGALPVLLALSANSPYWHGSDSGFASLRTPVFSMFPRVGIPRRFARYGEYVATVAAMLRSRAIPDPGFLWWDARLRPHLGTLEVRVPDAQSRLLDVAALAALVQCLVRRYAEGGRAYAPPTELLAENRFLASRDGLEARLLDDRRPSGRRAARAALAELLEYCAPQARELGCEAELADAGALAADPGYARQRRFAERRGPRALVARLADEYAHPPRAMVAAWAGIGEARL